MFLHDHPDLEAVKGLDGSHVIVDRVEWQQARLQLDAGTPNYLALSKRNLLTLLHKLVMGDSERALLKPGLGGPTYVTVVTDEEAYRNRAPGPMHPQTETFIRLADRALKVAAKQMQTDANPPTWAINAARDLAKRDGFCASDTCCCSEMVRDAKVIAAAHDAYFEE